MKGFHVELDLVAGLATITSAGSELVEKLSGVTALDLLDSGTMNDLDRILEASMRSLEATLSDAVRLKACSRRSLSCSPVWPILRTMGPPSPYRSRGPTSA